jgi:hypothetical protein
MNVQLNTHCHKNVHSLTYSVKAIDIVDKNTIGKIDDKNNCNVRDSYRLS